MSATLSPSEEAQLSQTIEMFEVITQSQPQDYQSLEILKEAYSKLGRELDVVGTSKRIAQAYVHLGQFSSAILEYETILQRFPDDPDVRAALQEIEYKSSNFGAPPPSLPEPPPIAMPAAAPLKLASNSAPPAPVKSAAKPVPANVDDGRETMRKIFVDSKIITAADFDLCWKTPDLNLEPLNVLEPFIQMLADKGVLLPERSLKLLIEKSRLAFLPLDKYDVDLELARKFPAAICRRWCVLPFDKMSKTILVATANPFNATAARELSEATQSRLLFYLVPPIELVTNIRKIFR